MEQGLQISSHGTGSVLQIWLDCPIAEDKKGETVAEASSKRVVNHNIYGLIKGKNIITKI